MRTFSRRTVIHVPTETLFAWHERPGALERLTPPWQSLTLERFEGIEDGQRAVMTMRAAGVPIKWIAEHRDYQEGHQFRDVQIKGPFEHWEHTHRVLPHDLEIRTSILEDRVEYELPVHQLAEPIIGRSIEREIVRMFAYRHRLTREDLERHFAARLPPLTVAVSGSSGLIGSALCAFLTTGGHTVVRLVRSRREAVARGKSELERAAFWDPERGEIDVDALHGVDAVINLAGEPVLGGRWTGERRARIMDSRTRGTRLLAETLASLPNGPTVFLSASGSGYYGDRGHERLTETSPPGEGFLADVTRAWEEATVPASEAGVRTCRLRIGAVLSPRAGPLALIRPFFALGLGGTVGSGRRWVAWISVDDVLYAILHLLSREDLSGPFNLCTPHPVSQRHLSDALGSTMKRPTVVRVPAIAARILGGDQAVETVLSSTRLVPERLANSAFRFAYPRLPEALAHMLGRSTSVPIDSEQL